MNASRPHPLQNRVTPFGEIVAIAQRGLFTGNRGIIHDPRHPDAAQTPLVFKGLADLHLRLPGPPPRRHGDQKLDRTLLPR